MEVTQGPCLYACPMVTVLMMRLLGINHAWRCSLCSFVNFSTNGFWCTCIELEKNIENKKIPWIELRTVRFPQYLEILELIDLPVTEKLRLSRWYWAARLSLQCTELGIRKVESCVLGRDWKGRCVLHRIEGIGKIRKILLLILPSCRTKALLKSVEQ